jgi:hypothetical protein
MKIKTAKKLPKAGDAIERRVVADVKKYGWHIVGVEGDEDGPSFSYSVGLQYTFQHPELFVMGLPHNVAGAFINDIGKRIREGRSFTAKSSVDGVAEGLTLRFARFGKRYYKEYLGCANWFYKSMDYPVLQLVWPDPSGNFPWDAKFDGALFQHQLLLSEDRKTSWPFPVAKNTMAFAHDAIFKTREPIVRVSHDDDGDWQFLDGVSTNASKNAMLVALSTVVQRDPSVLDVANLPIGWCATRSKPGSPWKRIALDEEQE